MNALLSLRLKMLIIAPDKRGYRRCGVLVRKMSGNPTNQELATFDGI